MKLKIISCALLLLSFFSCNKDQNQDIYTTIPNVEVDLYLNLNEPANYNLTIVGGWRYMSGGSRGLIIYRGQDQFYAYDRHTPHNSDESCAVVSVDSTNFFAVDACTGSRFLLANGTVVDGSATIPLKQYRTSLVSDVLRVYN
ncbi:MAG: hypothetical protein CL840_11085 [Crocinitomicaceae bacterium]|nr:hypothetical protein [Crocinitomicaceae bacterium]|tara:strand:+ start:987 stop:1415 length:429 start_codon:yes stop_codon:yes gene_type:complete